MSCHILKKSLLILVLLELSANAGTIKIAVAANVSYAINDLKKEFNKLYPNTKVRVILGSSGKLTAQISHGAPYEIFMSANMKYPKALYKKDLAITKPIIYAKGSLVYLSNKQKDFTKGINILKDKNIRRIAIANPKTAPYGIASVEALKNAKVYKNIKSKLIYAESISQTVSYTISASDIGLIPKSSLFSSKMRYFKENINWKEINSALYTPINQGIVILKQGKQNTEVKAFYDFILSSKAKEIFKTYGYQIL